MELSDGDANEVNRLLEGGVVRVPPPTECGSDAVAAVLRLPRPHRSRYAEQRSIASRQRERANMPIYEYVCRGCGEGFEALIRGTDTPSCPACEGQDLERLMSLPTVKSDSTRSQSLRAAKKRDASQAKDRMHERIKYEQSHDRHG
jgi:putative FmdB family regulatory protein